MAQVMALMDQHIRRVLPLQALAACRRPGERGLRLDAGGSGADVANGAAADTGQGCTVAQTVSESDTSAETIRLGNAAKVTP